MNNNLLLIEVITLLSITGLALMPVFIKQITQKMKKASN